MIGKDKMEDGFIIVFQHEGTREIVARTAKDEKEVCLIAERLELMGCSVLYVLSIYDDKVKRYL